MSGHSKWHNIQQKKGKTDAARANIFTKIGREIAVAVKDGGADPNSNSKLAQVIAKAKDNNMPNDNIMRSIKKASGELGSINYEDMTYEGYGVGGTAIIVEALTDNKNRTAGDVRHLFDKFGGSMGTTGCVSFMFKRRGIITIAKADIEEDDLMMYALELEGFEDINSEADFINCREYGERPEIFCTRILKLNAVSKSGFGDFFDAGELSKITRTNSASSADFSGLRRAHMSANEYSFNLNIRVKTNLGINFQSFSTSSAFGKEKEIFGYTVLKINALTGSTSSAFSISEARNIPL